MGFSCYYMVLIFPAAALTVLIGHAFRARDLMEDSWRGIAAVTYALTFPAWVLAAHSSSHFILAALGRGPWDIMNQDLMTPGHYVLTSAQCCLLSAVALGFFSRSWFLLAAGLVNAVPTTALMLLDLPGLFAGMAYWLVATGIALRAWGRGSPARAHIPGPSEEK